LAEIVTREPQVAFADEPLRRVVNRMAESGFTRFPVLDPNGNKKIVGMVSLKDLLLARTRNLEDERARQRVLRIRMPFGRQRQEEKVLLTEETD
jgi:CBS domain containing-hemolysin-like protein